MANDRRDIWRRFLEVHQYVKDLTLAGEESGYELETFLQPLQEQRHALEHIVRARAAEFGIKESPAPDYIDNNLDKALGHIYRCFFDTADWLSINIRGKIIDTFEPYSRQSLVDLVPEYYQKIRPQLERINHEIAKIRGKKDIPSGPNTIPEIEKYGTILKELIDFQEKIESYIPQLQECKNEEEDKERKESNKARYQTWGAIALVILSALLGIFLQKLFL